MSENDLITVGDAYRAMYEFLDAYWKRGGEADEQIAIMLSSVQYGDEFGPTKSADPASWYDWIAAIEKVKA